MEPGDRVEILSPHDGRWLAGFELAVEVHDEGGRLVGRFVRRTSDGELVLWRFAEDEVRPDRFTRATRPERPRRSR